MKLLACLAIVALFFASNRAPVVAQAGTATITTELVNLTDARRARQVPVLFYRSAQSAGRSLKPAILSHGYGGQHSDYSFIATWLAANGYFVASVQHEIPGDQPLPSTGKPYEARMPSWQRGVENILFVLGELKKTRPELDFGQLLLVGHSHGGDTSMLFARDYPALVHTVISLDNRRMPFPRTARPYLLSLRSSDQVPDDGVLPSPAEQATLGMRVITLPATRHDDMWDGASEAQKKEILDHLARFLAERRP